jgi:hypothetical protein
MTPTSASHGRREKVPAVLKNPHTNQTAFAMDFTG